MDSVNLDPDLYRGCLISVKTYVRQVSLNTCILENQCTIVAENLNVCATRETNAVCDDSQMNVNEGSITMDAVSDVNRSVLLPDNNELNTNNPSPSPNNYSVYDYLKILLIALIVLFLCFALYYIYDYFRGDSALDSAQDSAQDYAQD